MQLFQSINEVFWTQFVPKKDKKKDQKTTNQQRQLDDTKQHHPTLSPSPLPDHHPRYSVSGEGMGRGNVLRPFGPGFSNVPWRHKNTLRYCSELMYQKRPKTLHFYKNTSLHCSEQRCCGHQNLYCHNDTTIHSQDHVNGTIETLHCHTNTLQHSQDHVDGAIETLRHENKRTSRNGRWDGYNEFLEQEQVKTLRHYHIGNTNRQVLFGHLLIVFAIAKLFLNHLL